MAQPKPWTSFTGAGRVRWSLSGLLLSNLNYAILSPIMENQMEKKMEKKMENEMETGGI